MADVDEKDLVVHDETCEDPAYAFLLSRLGIDVETPTPVGVFRQVERPTYEDALVADLDKAKEAMAGKTLADMYSGFGKVSTWDV